LGQELFNALIALVASILIGSTAVWVSTHGREMVLNMKDKGGRLVSGDLPAKTLSVIIALAVWREGAEIVLFSYGLLLSGLSLTTFLTGAIAGALAGSILGAGLYFGMVQINTKHIFKATSYLLLFIAAGMFALAAKYLVAAGYFGGLSDILWDTSHILSEQSFVGQVLHMFFGYSDSPMIIEVIYYVLFLTLSLLAISLIKRKKL